MSLVCARARVTHVRNRYKASVHMSKNSCSRAKLICIWKHTPFQKNQEKYFYKVDFKRDEHKKFARKRLNNEQ